MSSHNAPAIFSEFLGVIEPYPLTDDELVNYEVYDRVIMLLAKVARKNKHWDEPLKRRSAYEYVRIVVLGKAGDFYPNLGDVHYRSSTLNSELYTHLAIPWIREAELALIQDTIRLYLNEAQSSTL